MVFIVSDDVMFYILFIVMLYMILKIRNVMKVGDQVESSLNIVKNRILSISIG